MPSTMSSISRRALIKTASLTPLLATSNMYSQTSASGHLVYAGTYTNKSSKGIYAYRFDGKSGELTTLGLMAETPNPTFLAISANHRALYAVNEVGNYNGTHSGLVSGFSIDHLSGKLNKINSVASGGSGPCHLSVDHTGHALFVANYGSGSADSFRIMAKGELSPAVSQFQYSGHSADPKRQEGPHTHCTTVSPDNRYVLVNDLGLDRIMVYRLDANTAKLTPNDPPYWTAHAGTGPRHLAFHPKAKWAYCVTEMGNTIDTLAWDAEKGVLTNLQTVSTLPSDFHGENTAAEIAVDATGHFVYASNRGHDSIARFSIDQQTGKLTSIGFTPSGGKSPRFFTLDTTGRWLLAANQDSGNIVIFRRDPKTGLLQPSGKVYELDGAVCLAFA